MKLGAFELLHPVGEGGMGTVWRAKHLQDDIDVAVKVMRHDVMDDPDFHEAFELEVRSVASLDHPNIVTILDFGRVPESVASQSQDAFVVGAPYLVMEFGHGGAVDDYFQDLGWPDVRELMLVILDALAHAHARNVIHRDLKPENILVGCGPKWDVKLTDFGLAHAADRFHDSGKVETAWGTPQYMAPEQIRGYWREYGPWTDLYGLGCMAYELICSQWPYDGETIWQIGQGHLEEPIPALEPRFEVPEGTEGWIWKLLAKQRSNRFQHAADAAYELAQLAALDDQQGFGLLVTPPVDSAVADRADDPAGHSGVAATQLMPELDSAQTFKTVQYSPPDRTSRSHGDHEVSAPLQAQRPPLPLNWRKGREGVISNELIGISTGLFGLRSIPLVDREEERDWLWSLLRGVDETGRAQHCTVEGAAGTGKSQLVQWFCRRAKEVGGARVLKAYHSPVLGPADGLVPMMERFLRSSRLDADKRRQYLSGVLLAEGLVGDFELSALLTLFDDSVDGDEVSAPASTSYQSSGEERYAVIYRYLSLLARRRPIVIWLDDVQWGLDALGFAGYVRRQQEVDPAPILVVMTARSEALGERPHEQRALRSLIPSGSDHHWNLQLLAKRDIERLVRQLLRLDKELAEHIIDRSEGVPLFAVQLVEDWVARGKLVMRDDGFVLRAGTEVTIPDDLHQLWEERIQGFLGAQGEDLEAILELAAALGQEVDTAEWKQAIDVAGLEASDGLVERLADEDLAHPMEEGWRFSHGLLAESLQRNAREEGRWKEWNASCARALSAIYGEGKTGLNDRLAWHWVEAGQVERALVPLSGALDEAIERSEFDHARALIDWRLTLVDDAPSWRLQTKIDEARLACYRGNYQKGAEVAQTAAREAEKAQLSQLAAQAKLWAGVGLRFIGELDCAGEALNSARNGFEDTAQRDRCARAVLELGRVEEKRGDYALASQHFEAARESFAALDDTFGEAQAFNALGDVLRQSGEFDAAHQACLAALERFRKLENVSGIADCLNDLAEWSRLRGDLKKAKEFADESLRLYRALGSGLEHFVRLNLAMILLEDKAFGEARTAFLELVKSFGKSAQRGLEAQARAGLLAANAGLSRWEGGSDILQAIEGDIDATGVHMPMAARALSMAIEYAREAGESDLVNRAERIVAEQRRSRRNVEEVVDE